MRIAINALPFTGYGGLTYLKNIIPLFCELGTKNRYVVFVSHRNIDQLRFDYPNITFLCSRFAGKSFLHRMIWEQFILPFWLLCHPVDVLFTASNLDIFFAPTRTVIAVRNMEPFFATLIPSSTLLAIRLKLLAILSRFSLKTATHAIFVSGTSRKYFERTYRVPRDKTSMVYHGRSSAFHPALGTEPHSDQGPLPCPYVFASSKMVAYANLHNLVHAFKRVTDHFQGEVWLVIAGGGWDSHYESELHRIIKDCRLENRVLLQGYVDTPRMVALFRQAECFVFPSRLEACPNTLIEAMSCATPIAASDIGVMREFCGDAAIYFDPLDPGDISDQILRLLYDSELRAQLRQRALHRARIFDWGNTARQTMQVLISTAESC